MNKKEENMQKEENIQKEEIDKLVTEYLNQMDDLHKKAMLIAKEHLGMSFNIVKSVGFTTLLEKAIRSCKASPQLGSDKLGF